MQRYSAEQKRSAVKHYLSHGRCNAFTRREISCPGYTQAWSGYSERDNPMGD
ncbi:MAG: hypothetical protein ACFNZW_06895 [Coriobacteriaceae bacterium]